MPWFISLLVGIVLNVVSYLLLPKPKQPKPEAATDLDDPVAESGKPVPVVFGSMLVKGLNLLYFGDKELIKREITEGGKK